jgi:hypothetical protein
MDFVVLLQQEEQPTFETLPRKAKRSKPTAKTLLPEDHHYKARFGTRSVFMGLRKLWLGEGGAGGGGQGSKMSGAAAGEGP